jgi:hypothetical protein
MRKNRPATDEINSLCAAFGWTEKQAHEKRYRCKKQGIDIWQVYELGTGKKRTSRRVKEIDKLCELYGWTRDNAAHRRDSCIARGLDPLEYCEKKMQEQTEAEQPNEDGTGVFCFDNGQWRFATQKDVTKYLKR